MEEQITITVADVTVQFSIRNHDFFISPQKLRYLQIVLEQIVTFVDCIIQWLDSDTTVSIHPKIVMEIVEGVSELSYSVGGQTRAFLLNEIREKSKPSEPSVLPPLLLPPPAPPESSTPDSPYDNFLDSLNLDDLG